MDCTAIEWNTTDAKRALFSACALIDLMTVTDDPIEYDRISTVAADAIVDDGIAFALSYDTTIVLAIFCGETEILIIAYQPSKNNLDYRFLEASSTFNSALKLSVVRQALESNNSKFYIVNSLDHMNYLDSIYEIIDN